MRVGNTAVMKSGAENKHLGVHTYVELFPESTADIIVTMNIPKHSKSWNSKVVYQVIKPGKPLTKSPSPILVEKGYFEQFVKPNVDITMVVDLDSAVTKVLE